MMAYRLRRPATVAIRERNGFRLKELSVGSLFITMSPGPDHNGMVTGTSNGNTVLIFTRDLEERAEIVGLERAMTLAAAAAS